MDKELHGLFFEDIAIGMSAASAKTVTEADIFAYAGLSGDFNPVHVNDEFARDSFFKGRIAHGMLSASFISTVLGMRLPGPGCVYVSQSLRFRAPVRIGDTVTALVEVTETSPAKRFVTLRTVCSVGGKPVIEGEAVVMVPARP